MTETEKRGRELLANLRDGEPVSAVVIKELRADLDREAEAVAAQIRNRDELWQGECRSLS